jgi:hypothetical protein
VLHLSRFEPDPSTFSAFIACLWQGDVPASLELRSYLYTSTEPLSMVLLWEGDDDAVAFMERAFGGFGVFATEVVTDRTPSMLAALARDLDGFGESLRVRGADEQAIADALDLRRRGKEAATQDAARVAAAELDAERGGA